MLAVTRWTLGAGLFFSGLCIGWLLSHSEPISGETEREEVAYRRLTSPYLECAGIRDMDRDLVRARNRVEELLDRWREEDPTLSVSVYARDLLNGPWVGIDERRGYEPASLMKVWVLFHALARMEEDPSIRDREYEYPGPQAMPSPDNLTDRPPEERMTPGARYRYEELVERMIIHSDNHAKDLLLSDVPPGAVEDFMAAVGMEVILDGNRPVMDPRSYSALFRTLFNSSLFSRPTSEWALDLLSRGRYQNGLRASVPSGITVASKFGIHRHTAAFPGNGSEADSGTASQSGSQVHECGIVYAPGGPYVLCVMTRSRARDTDELSGLLREIGRIFYRARAD